MTEQRTLSEIVCGVVAGVTAFVMIVAMAVGISAGEETTNQTYKTAVYLVYGMRIPGVVVGLYFTLAGALGVASFLTLFGSNQD